MQLPNIEQEALAARQLGQDPDSQETEQNIHGELALTTVEESHLILVDIIFALKPEASFLLDSQDD